jgi:nitrite reductase/ring-hydroxylating ferredoxin subunit/multimeric flavodoxin WrbA
MTKITINRKEKSQSLRYLCLKSDIIEGAAKHFSIFNSEGSSLDVAVFNVSGNFYAISDICAHKGGPLSKGILKKNIVTCPWHGWKYDVRSGKSPHKGGDNVDGFDVKVVGNKLYVDSTPTHLHTSQYKPHEAYGNLQDSVKNYLAHMDKDSSIPIDAKIHVLGISTTSTNDDVAPRKSTSESSLEFALDYAKNKLNADCTMIKLRKLKFRHCEGFYSKNAKACIFPCSISEIDKDDQMLEIYERIILWADVVIVSTPIRWGNASSLYYQMIQRMNCVQNQSVTNQEYLIRDKAAAFIITGGQDNIQHVAGEMLSFWSQLGFIFGKFPFVGWSRGWYAEDTENNYKSMTSENAVAMRKDIKRTVLGAVQMANLLRKNKYDEQILKSK